MGTQALSKILISQLFLARMYRIVTDPTLQELARGLTVVPMTDSVEIAAADQAAAVTIETTTTVTPEKPKRAPRKSRAVAAPEPVEKPKRAPRKPRAVAAPEPVKTSETAPLVDLFGGTLDGHTWRKLQRGPWPQAMDGATGEPVTPVRAVRLLADSTTGVYIHVERADAETGNPVHMYVHSSIITAWRIMWGPA